MNRNQVTLLSTWSNASGAESRRLPHLLLLEYSGPLSTGDDFSNRAPEARRFSGGVALSKGGGSRSRQLETFSGLMRTPRWFYPTSADAGQARMNLQD
jgi:hypothetical protein